MGYVKVSGHKRCLLKTAMITGVTGQDGSYLAELLLNKGYKVVGLKRRTSTICTERLDHIFEHPNFKTLKSDTASILCYHYGTSPENDLYGEDNLKINILTREYADLITVEN